ncbi:Putative hydrolase [Chromobacterium vaccinii]|uniref:alpha/beta fold hydrolase n=1 Tax=Chromobacterium vaccinii TaxID=1108595 RepID=UPI0006181EC4|nr:alpha/beta hydrolase [Chromobacterium vaccinii]QND84536.1 Putative hydrolase [Chromobacterium vaccinii]QND89767.1 Putative hydrolase [Chromobacterium vaccinii]
MQYFSLSQPQAMLRCHDIPGHGAPLIMLHGLGCASSFDYPRLLAEPGLAGRRALLVDLLGHGFSDKPEDFSYDPGAQAQALAQWIEQLGLREFDLYGHSMGGSIAIDLATLMPDRIRRLVLAEPNLDSGGGAYSRALASWSEADYVARGHREIIRTFGADSPNWAGSMAVASPLAVHRAAKGLIAGSAVSWREQLRALSMPRRIIFGEKSLPDPDVEWLPRHGIDTSIVADAGHSLAWDNPAGLAEAIAAALD